MEASLLPTSALPHTCLGKTAILCVSVHLALYPRISPLLTCVLPPSELSSAQLCRWSWRREGIRGRAVLVVQKEVQTTVEQMYTVP